MTDTVRDFALTPDQPHLQLAAPVLSATLAFGEELITPITLTNDGPRTLTITLSIPPLEWSIATETPAAALYDMSSFPPLTLADDSVYPTALDLGFSVPVYGQLVDRLYLSSNGWVSVAQPNLSQQFAFCLPNDRLPAGALAPFWADLDPSVGGVVRAGQVLSDTFVVSFENVPPWRETPDPLGPTYTFQLSLHADGRIQFLYGAMGTLPARWSVGVSQSAERGQSLACYRTGPALGGQSWVVQNQSLPWLWLHGSPETLNIPPGGAAVLNASLRGLGYVPWRSQPFEGIFRLTTNDPYQPVVDLPATVTVTTPAPFSVWLPVVRR
jgi:hypothetical protein